jgi:hypothetical protein
VGGSENMGLTMLLLVGLKPALPVLIASPTKGADKEAV